MEVMSSLSSSPGHGSQVNKSLGILVITRAPYGVLRGRIIVMILTYLASLDGWQAGSLGTCLGRSRVSEPTSPSEHKDDRGDEGDGGRT